MRCGISSACFYPQDTLNALNTLIDLQTPVAELFINSSCEYRFAYLRKLKRTAMQGKINITAIHPFSSPIENILFASAYKQRVNDGIELHKPYLKACKMLGAKMLVIHGMHKENNDISVEEHIENMAHFIAAGEKYGVKVCLENVSYCKLGQPKNVEKARKILGKSANFVLDLKQVRRAGINLDEMLDAMQDRVVHVHISDFDQKNDCICPGKGNFDFGRLINHLNGFNYDGSLIIELYKNGYDKPEDLQQAMQYINAFI